MLIDDDKYKVHYLDGDELDERYKGRLRPGCSLTSCATTAVWHRYIGHEDLRNLATATLLSVAHNHPLIDGNKRASLILADEFLMKNGMQFNTHIGMLLVKLALNAAEGLEAEYINKKLHKCVGPLTDPRPFAERYPRVLEILADR